MGHLQKMAEEDAERAKREAERASGEGGEGGRRGGFDWRSMMSGRGGGARGTLVSDLTRLGQGKDLEAGAIANRRGILTSLRGTTNDEGFQAMFASVDKRLNELANPTEETSSRFRLEDPREAARREEMRKRWEEMRNRGGQGGPCGGLASARGRGRSRPGPGGCAHRAERQRGPDPPMRCVSGRRLSIGRHPEERLRSSAGGGLASVPREVRRCRPVRTQ